MPIGYRRLVIAICGCLIVGAGLPTPQKRSQIHEQTKTESVTKGSKTVAAAVVDSVKGVHPALEKDPCYQANEDHASELCAQWKAADWTKTSAIGIEWQVGVAALSAALLLASLHYTRKALRDNAKALKVAQLTADSAIEAVRQSKRAADAAEMQASIAKHAFEALERPYIFVNIQAGDFLNTIDVIGGQVCRDLGPPERHIEISYDLTNYGRTPGIISTISAIIEVAPAIPNDFRYLPNVFLGSDMVLKPDVGNVFRQSSVLTYDKAVFTSILNQNSIVYFIGRVDYQDVSGKQFSTNFCWRYYPVSTKREMFISQAGCEQWNYRT